MNLAFWQSFLTLKNGQLVVACRARGGDGAYIAFIAFYAICVAVTWAVFTRERDGRLEGV